MGSAINSILILVLHKQRRLFYWNFVCVNCHFSMVIIDKHLSISFRFLGKSLPLEIWSINNYRTVNKSIPMTPINSQLVSRVLTQYSEPRRPCELFMSCNSCISSTLARPLMLLALSFLSVPRVIFRSG